MGSGVNTNFVFFEDMYHKTTVKTWSDVALLSGTNFQNTANEKFMEGKCIGSTWKSNIGAETSGTGMHFLFLQNISQFSKNKLTFS